MGLHQDRLSFLLFFRLIGWGRHTNPGSHKSSYDFLLLTNEYIAIFKACDDNLTFLLLELDVVDTFAIDSIKYLMYFFFSPSGYFCMIFFIYLCRFFNFILRNSGIRESIGLYRERSSTILLIVI